MPDSFPPFRVAPAAALLLLAGLIPPAAVAQQAAVSYGANYLGSRQDLFAGPKQDWAVRPEISGGVRWSDNAGQAPDGSQRSDTIVSLIPAVSVNGRSAAAVGTFRFNLRNETYLDDSSRSHTDLYGGGQGSMDLYERKLMLDSYINLSRQRLSIFAPSPASGAYSTEGQTNVGVYSLSPYLRLQSPGDYAGEVRYTATLTDASSQDSLGDQVRQDISLHFGNASTPRPFGWDASLTHNITQYDKASDTTASSARVTGVYGLTPLLRLRAVVGYERNDYVTSFDNEQVIYGGGLEWNPSPRMRLFGQAEKRFFGTGYNAEFSWRGPRSGISARFSRDVSSTSSTLASSDLLNLYLSYLLSLQNEIPDLIERSRKVAEIWAARGLPSEIGPGTSYVSQSYYLEHRGQIAASINGLRNSLGLSLGFNERTQLIDSALLSPDDIESFNRTREATLGAIINHALSRVTNLSLAASYSRTRGEGSDTLEGRRRTASLIASTQFGPRTSGSLSYTYSASRGVTNYEENSIAANVGLRF